jgi:transcriptional regulator with XRE-family HTH domain
LPFCHAKLAAPRPIDPAYPTELRTIGDHIRARRLELSLLQREVAEDIGTSPESIRNWELGKAEPSIRCLPAIMRFLGYSPLPGPQSLGEALVTARRLRGISRKTLARELRIDPATLWRWESGNGEPSLRYKRRVESLVARALDLGSLPTASGKQGIRNREVGVAPALAEPGSMTVGGGCTSAGGASGSDMPMLDGQRHGFRPRTRCRSLEPK